MQGVSARPSDQLPTGQLDADPCLSHSACLLFLPTLLRYVLDLPRTLLAVHTTDAGYLRTYRNGRRKGKWPLKPLWPRAQRSAT